MKVIEFADILNVPILKAGTHHSKKSGDVVVTAQDLDYAIVGSNACKPIIKESLSTGKYRGNNFTYPKMPGVLNLMHDAILDETIKERVKDVDWEFGKEEINGEIWMTQNFRGVPQDVAKSIQNHFPYRSVELIPLTNPATGISYPMVVRSTAFLDKYTPPAVKGQTKDFHIEFAEGEESPVLVLFSGAEYQQPTQGAEAMMEEKQEKTLATPESVPEVNESEALIKELQAKRTANEAFIAELQAKQTASDNAVRELQAKQDVAEVREFMAGLGHKTIQGEHSAYNVSAAFLEVIEPVITGTHSGSVIELSEGKQPARKTLENVFEKIIELAGKDALLVPVTELGGMTHKAPGDNQKKSVFDRAVELQQSEKISYSEALLRVKKEDK